MHLDPSRFRPNIVVDGIPAWSEFEWGHEYWKDGVKIQGDVTVRSASSTDTEEPLRLRFVSRTVRCAATNIDNAAHPPSTVFRDFPAALAAAFPEHGPYLGVYMKCVQGGTVSIGDAVICIP